MAVEFIGEHLLARDENNRPRVRIATVFPNTNTIVTLPGIHATQRLAYLDAVNRRRVGCGERPLTDDEQDEMMMAAVDLVIEQDDILIRPDPDNMPLAFDADDLLQTFVSKKKIKFLLVLNPHVRDAIKRHGERWRISPLPRSPQEMQRMILASRIGITGREIYYYNKTTGTRFLTLHEFELLDRLDDAELRKLLVEIRDYSTRTNRLRSPEIAFFMNDGEELHNEFTKYDFAALSAADLRLAFSNLRKKFAGLIHPDFRDDDLQSAEWRSRMYAALIGHTDKEVSEEALLGLSAEFFMQLEWLPGGRIENGEFILDSVFDEESTDCGIPERERIVDEKARGFIFNFIRDYGDLEYVNIGRVVGSLSNRKMMPGRRGVYLAEVKQKGNDQPILRIIRMQKWGVREHLDEGWDLLAAVLESEQYTEYILDRRLGCRQLGMNLTQRTAARKVIERYTGGNGRYSHMTLWAAYFERDFVPGVATDKIPGVRFGDDAYAIRFARLLGRAAAPNLIVGRTDLQGNVIFDDGDELIVENHSGLPIDIIVADHTGTFGDYRRDLRDIGPAYANALNKRLASLGNPRAFGEAFLDAFVDRFLQIQAEYRKRRRAFDTLFKHERRDEAGSFAFRWERVLMRLDSTDPAPVAERIRQNFKIP